ncbi:MAG: FxsA family protein [Actinomycetota bacterium]|nr:FxsA family protein [Actinomycetota bacterium]
MLPALLAFFLVLPFLEVWVAIQVAGVIGGFPTLLVIFAMSVLGVVLLRREGTTVWRKASEEMAAGRPPTTQLLDGALVLVGGVSLVVPGFITGVFGLLLLLPPVRALLRPVILAWFTARAARAARSGAMRGVFVRSVVDADGRVRTESTSFGDVVDSEGWELRDAPPELPRSQGPRPGVIDVDGSADER